MNKHFPSLCHQKTVNSLALYLEFSGVLVVLCIYLGLSGVSKTSLSFLTLNHPSSLRIQMT